MSQLIQDWITQQAASNPDQPAIAWKHDRVTYGELERLTNQFAELLLES